MELLVIGMLAAAMGLGVFKMLKSKTTRNRTLVSKPADKKADE